MDIEILWIQALALNIFQVWGIISTYAEKFKVGKDPGMDHTVDSAINVLTIKQSCPAPHYLTD